MESWIAFARGPLFRLSFVLMLLGLLRIYILAFGAGMKAQTEEMATQYAKEGVWGAAFEHLGFIGRLWKIRPIQSILATVFHAGYLVVPLFLASHVLQWRKGVGFSWTMLSQTTADNMTLMVIIIAPILALFRFFGRSESGKSRFWQLIRPLILIIPFVTGYICVNGFVAPTFYYTSMLIHVWSGNILMLAIAFTPIADCIISPVARVSYVAGSKFGCAINPIWRNLIGEGSSK